MTQPPRRRYDRPALAVTAGPNPGGTAQFQPHRAPPADFRPLTRNATSPRLLAVLSAYVRATSHRPDPGRHGRIL